MKHHDAGGATGGNTSNMDEKPRGSTILSSRGLYWLGNGIGVGRMGPLITDSNTHMCVGCRALSFCVHPCSTHLSLALFQPRVIPLHSLQESRLLRIAGPPVAHIAPGRIPM